MVESNKENIQSNSYYDEVKVNDIISKFLPLLRSSGYRIRDEDGKICVTQPACPVDTPWHHVIHDAFFDCQRWHTVLFDLFSSTMPKEQAFVPSSCQQCWKVVARPTTLLGLFSLLDLQKALGHPSKCGIEVRPYVHGLYGGYFYNHSLEQGLECYKTVRKMVDETPHLGKEVSVILKRGCTEYEKRLGDSTKWEVTKDQLSIETIVNKWFVRNDVVREQPAHAIATVHRAWIEFAYQNADPTYIHFTGGKPLYEPVKTYHHLAEATEDERKKAFAEFEVKHRLGYDL